MSSSRLLPGFCLNTISLPAGLNSQGGIGQAGADDAAVLIEEAGWSAGLLGLLNRSIDDFLGGKEGGGAERLSLDMLAIVWPRADTEGAGVV